MGGSSLSQVWLFIVAPLVGGILAASLYCYFVPAEALAEWKAVLKDRKIGRTAAKP